MKTITRLLTIALVTVAAGIAASAQTVSIRNISGEDRKVCFFNIDDAVGVVPKHCITMKRNENAAWENKDRKQFMIKVFKPGVLDEYLYTRRLPEDTDRMIVAEGGRFGFGRVEVKTPPKRYFLKVCNQQWDQKVFFVLGFETPNGFWTKGWWNIEKGKCLDFPLSEVMKSNWGIDYGTMPKIHFYARVTGDRELEWRGGDNDYNLCINTVSVFEKKQFGAVSNGAKEPLACEGKNEKRVRFRRLDGSGTSFPAFNLRF